MAVTFHSSQMPEPENNSFSPAKYVGTFRRLEKQFENLACSDKPAKRDILATIAPAGRTLYTFIRQGLLNHLSPPFYLRSKTLLPELTEAESNDHLDKNVRPSAKPGRKLKPKQLEEFKLKVEKMLALKEGSVTKRVVADLRHT